jgi:hypothetical protein
VLDRFIEDDRFSAVIGNHDPSDQTLLARRARAAYQRAERDGGTARVRSRALLCLSALIALHDKPWISPGRARRIAPGSTVTTADVQ